MTEWDKASSTRASRIRTLEGLIPGYSYAMEDLALRTDEGFHKVLGQNLRTARDSVFNVLHTAYELHRELLLKDFQDLKDRMDSIAHSIRVRAFKWDSSKTQRWLERLIDYDYEILASTGNVIKATDDLHRLLLSSKEVPRDLKRLSEVSGSIRSSLDDLAAMLKERDAVANIRDAILEDSFEKMREDIRKGF